MCPLAVALAARRYMQRHLDPCAVMRCLGATQSLLLRLFLCQFVVLGVIAAGLGCTIGYLAHFALHAWLARLLATPLPPPGLLPVVQGVAVGMLLLFGFAVPPLLQLKRVATLRVLRGELGSPQAGLLGAYLLGFAALIFAVVMRGEPGPLLTRVEAAGRMSLSNYLATSIVMPAIFYGWGLGLFSHVPRA